jgi:hypothetical protein
MSSPDIDLLAGELIDDRSLDSADGDEFATLTSHVS